MFYHEKIVCTWNFVAKNSTRRKEIYYLLASVSAHFIVGQTRGDFSR